VKVDIDEVASRQGHSSGQELAEKYPVRSAPAQAILDSEATVLRRIRGYVKTGAVTRGRGRSPGRPPSELCILYSDVP
jgi:hypothetical protein